MCSTFQVLLVGAVLRRVDAGTEHLDRRVTYGPDGLLDYAPVTRAQLHVGFMGVGALCAAAIEVSDNTAATLFLQGVGGPPVVTGFTRSLGDTVTRLDRTEPNLNSASRATRAIRRRPRRWPRIFGRCWSGARSLELRAPRPAPAARATTSPSCDRLTADRSS